MKKNLQETLAEALGSRSVKKRAAAFEALLASNLAPEEKAKITRQLLTPDAITDLWELAQYQEKLAWGCRKARAGTGISARVEVCRELLKTSERLGDPKARFECRRDILEMLYKGERQLRPVVLDRVLEVADTDSNYAVRAAHYRLITQSVPASSKLGVRALEGAWGLLGNLSKPNVAAVCSMVIGLGSKTPFYLKAYETLASVADELVQKDDFQLKAYTILAGCPIEGNPWRESALEKAMAMIGQIEDVDEKLRKYNDLAHASDPVKFGGDTRQIDKVARAMLKLAEAIEDPMERMDACRDISCLPLSPRLAKRADDARRGASYCLAHELHGEEGRPLSLP